MPDAPRAAAESCLVGGVPGLAGGYVNTGRRNALGGRREERNKLTDF